MEVVSRRGIRLLRRMLPSPPGTCSGGLLHTPPLLVVRVLVPFSSARPLGIPIAVRGTWVCLVGAGPGCIVGDDFEVVNVELRIAFGYTRGNF